MVLLAVQWMAFPAAALLALATAMAEPEPPAAATDRIQGLIQRLGDGDFHVRQRAQEELARMGFAAFDALSAASESNDLEIAARAKYLLRLIHVEWVADDDPEDVKQILQDYEGLSAQDRRDRMQRLAGLPGGAGVPALCRLLRYEQSEVLSKSAALEMLRNEPHDEAGRRRLAELVREQIRLSPRQAARWLLAYQALRDDPEQGLPQWGQLVEQEQASLAHAPEKTSVELVAVLIYYLAEAQAREGDVAAADRTAARALALNPGGSELELFAHLELAQDLMRRGLNRWAEAEYRHVTKVGVPEYAAFAFSRLAEMKHDQGENLDAAEALRQAIELAGRGAARGRDFGTELARMNYFHSRHWAEQGDRDQEKKYLDEAIRHDPTEIDVLIARYRLPEASDEYRRETIAMIEKAAAAMREQIRTAPEEPGLCNQFAWLIGNTEGDLDEALEYAKKCVATQPESGAFHDTLARVYFARRDFENAVKHQTLAASLEPHSGLIARQLELFRKELEKSKAGK